jgi:hypothetical protein
MRNGAILFVLLMLTGCANFQEVVGTIPDAVGTVAAAEVFGGEVSMVPDPVEYATRDVEREGRIVYGDARRNTKAAISTAITRFFNKAK